jgi:hypothetical protein
MVLPHFYMPFSRRTERRLLGVGFRVEPVVTHPAPPTDPDVSNALIRFLGSQSPSMTLVHHFAALHAYQMLWTILGVGST